MESHIFNVKNIVEMNGKKIVDIEWYDQIYKWLDWYKGKVDNFHNYRIYNGRDYVSRERACLQMPKIISEDWATLLYNDRTTVKVEDSQQKKLEDIFEENRFNERFSNFVEMVMALGIGASVVYKNGKGNPKINFIVGPMIFPTKIENGEIVDCVFASVEQDRYYLNTHERQPNGSYKISNAYYSFDMTGKPIKEESKGVLESYTSPVKMFSIYKPCIVNNVDIFSPFGVSVFGNAIDRVKTVDLVYDSLGNEFTLGKKRLFLRQDLATFKPIQNADGSVTEVPIFDNNDTVFYSIPADEESGAEQIKEINPTLRTAEHISALQSALNMLSDACGLGNDRYNFQAGNVYTNTTQVISTQSKLYKTLLKHEKMLRSSMVEMIKAMLYVKNTSEYKGDVTIDFDDSIIEDTAEIQRRAMLELQAGVIDPTEYIVQVYKYTEEQAEEFVNKIKERNPQPEEEMPEGEDEAEELNA